MRSENIGSSPTTSGASSCATMAATIGGLPSAAPMPVSPSSVSTRMRVASLLTFVPRSVRCRFSFGTGADMGTAETLVIFMAVSLPRSRCARGSADLLQVPLAVAKQRLAKGEPLVVVADGQLVSHAHAAVQLDGLAAD